MKLKAYKKIRSELQSGDAVLFRGEGLISTLILWFCSIFKNFKRTKFSHIGMVVVDSGRVMLFESTTLNGKNGVQLNPLGRVLQAYKGQVYIRHLRCERDDNFQRILSMTIVELLGRPYEKNLIELMGAAAEIVHLFDGHRPDLSSIFCSELFTEVYQRESFLSPLIPSNQYDPDDYNFKGRVDGELRFSDKMVCLTKLVRTK